MFKELSGPISVQWELTSACNLNCFHCYNFWRGLASKTNKEVVRQPEPLLVAREIVNSGVFQVTITGGEPLSAIRRNWDGLLYLREAGVDLNLNSNLTLLNEEKLHLIKELGIKSILTSLISFDGLTHDSISNRPGSHEATCSGIKMAIAAGIRVAVNMVVTKNNLHHIIQTARLAKEMGVIGFCATKASKPCTCEDFSEFQLNRAELHKMFRDLLQVAEEMSLPIDSLEHYPSCAFPDAQTRTIIGGRNCSAGKTGCTIGFDGMVRPCSHAQQTYGNIESGLKQAWVAMDQWRKGEFVPEQCKQGCGEFPLNCGGGCRVEAYNNTGSIAGHDPYCIGGGPPSKKEIPSPHINETGIFSPVANLRFRSESEGEIAYVSVKNWLLVDKVLVNLLKSKEPFTAEDFAGLYDVSVERVYPTLRLLMSKRMICDGAKI